MRKVGEVAFADVDRSNGTGVVEFETEDGMERACKDLHDTDLRGSKISVKYDRPPRRDDNEDHGRRERSRSRSRSYDDREDQGNGHNEEKVEETADAVEETKEAAEPPKKAEGGSEEQADAVDGNADGDSKNEAAAEN